MPKGVTVAQNILGVGFAILILVGSIKMYKLENYALSMSAAIVAMIPCCSSCCCLIGLPMGIWALVVLNDANVKIAFK
jgi:ABC-type proline/glycine betaine transport system permease subunit